LPCGGIGLIAARHAPQPIAHRRDRLISGDVLPLIDHLRLHIRDRLIGRIGLLLHHGLLHGALMILHKAGRLKSGSPDLIAPILLGALTEAAVTIARAENEDKARAEARAAMAAVLSGLVQQA
jgi:hypothetical protein